MRVQRKFSELDDQNLGDAYTFVALERNSKLVLNIAMGKRDKQTADTFGNRVDFALLIKVYRASPEGERKCSPLKFRPWRRPQSAATSIPPVFALRSLGAAI